MGSGAIRVARYMVSPRPGRLDGPANHFGDLHRFADKISLEAAPESATGKCRVDEDGFGIQTRALRGQGLGIRLILRGRPDVPASPPDTPRPVLGSHRPLPINR